MSHRVLKTRKIAIIGSRWVGKTTLTSQFLEGTFEEKYIPTMEDTFRRVFNIQSRHLEIKLVDTAGHDDVWTDLLGQYTLDVHGFLVVYDVSRKATFQNASNLYEGLTDLTGNKNIPVVLVGNKTDLEESRQVSQREGRVMAYNYSIPFCETSAKDKNSVDEVFHTLVLEMERFESGANDAKSKCLIS